MRDAIMAFNRAQRLGSMNSLRSIDDDLWLGPLAAAHQVDRAEASRILRLAFLAPDIVTAILDGRQPVELTQARLSRCTELPAAWPQQRRILGFA